MPPLIVKFSEDGGGFACIALKVLFNEVPNTYDFDIYVDPRDRYSLLSYCSRDEQPSSVPNRYPFEQNKVNSLSEFNRVLSMPFRVNLKAAASN